MKKLKIKKIYDYFVQSSSSFLRITTLTKKGTVRDVKIQNFTKSMTIILFKPFLKRFFRIDQSKKTGFVEKKYDRLSGVSMASKYYQYGEETKFYYVGNAIEKLPVSEFRIRQRNNYCQIISQFQFDNVLEVGAGELAVVSTVADHFGPKVNYFALDLSLNRVYQGRQELLKRKKYRIQACKGNAVALPYPDNSFDIVYSSHALEHMPYDYQKAINEMCRVAKKAVVLFEPSYELGTFSQKIRILAQDYVKGIPQHLEKLKRLKKIRSFSYSLMNPGSLFNRTACHQINISTPTPQEDKEDNEFTQSDNFLYICPACHSGLDSGSSNLFCPRCEQVFFVFEGIPLLDNKYAFYIGNKYYNNKHTTQTKTT